MLHTSAKEASKELKIEKQSCQSPLLKLKKLLNEILLYSFLQFITPDRWWIGSQAIAGDALDHFELVLLRDGTTNRL